MELGERIKKFMSAKNLTQRGLGDKIGVSDVTIGNYISGSNKPKYEFWLGMAKHYPEVNLVWLLTGEGEMEMKNANYTIIDCIRFLNDNKEEASEYEEFHVLMEKLGKIHYNKSIEARISEIEKRLEQ
jgi:transcriptional regulator with XRE-family HTH domain